MQQILFQNKSHFQPKKEGFEDDFLSVGQPPYYKGMDYIYEDRGEVLDIHIFKAGEYELVSSTIVFHCIKI